MILVDKALASASNSITRTCGGDPRERNTEEQETKVLPAHAGLILQAHGKDNIFVSITRTCGGDPCTRQSFHHLI